ncbi:MAG: hypothetical protein ACI9AU_000197 [Bacteroidia bacterium]|jgi:hypothetical protein
MKLISLFLILFFSVNLKAQVEKYHIGLKQSPLSDSLMNSAYIKAKPRQFRSVYRLKWEDNSKVKVVSKPIDYTYKVKFKLRDETVMYNSKYFIVDGELTGYKLRARSLNSEDSANIFGLTAENLVIKVQFFQSGYVGMIEWNEFSNGMNTNFKLPLLLPAFGDLENFSTEGLLLILPTIKKVP